MASAAQKLLPLTHIRSRSRLPHGLPSRFCCCHNFRARGVSILAHGDEADPDSEASALGRRLNQAFEEYRAQKFAPNWLPFYPDASYWVPPCPPLTKMLKKPKDSATPLTDKEILAALASTSWTPLEQRHESQPGTETLPEELENSAPDTQAAALEHKDKGNKSDG